MPEALLPWVLFNAFVLLMLGLDLFVFHSRARAVSLKEALYWCLFWECLALSFNGYIYYARGLEDALNFFTGYLIEKSLSMDNLFVFILIFKYFQTPKKAMHKVLFWGVLGAMLMRALFIVLGIALISRFHSLIYLLGAFLVYTGIHLWRQHDKEIHPENNPVLKLFYRFFPVTKEYVGEQFFVRKAAVTLATPLFVTLLMIETIDIIFALDSIPAILAITTDPFIVYTSNIFAVLGLRSLYFVLSHMMELFHYLHHGLALILLFIGLKMLLSDVVHLQTVVALGFVLIVLLGCVFASILFPIKSKFF